MWGQFRKGESLCESRAAEHSHRVSEARALCQGRGGCSSTPLGNLPSEFPVAAGVTVGVVWGTVGVAASHGPRARPSLSAGSTAVMTTTISLLCSCCMPCAVPTSLYRGYNPGGECKVTSASGKARLRKLQ